METVAISVELPSTSTAPSYEPASR
jgi:hypothetical protein